VKVGRVAGTRSATTKGFQACVPSRSELEMTDLEALVVAVCTTSKVAPIRPQPGPLRVPDTVAPDDPVVQPVHLKDPLVRGLGTTRGCYRR
jgi:hypothetical protein